VEDQPADSGDLTTDPAEPDAAAAPVHRRHRMPLRRHLSASREEPAASEPTEGPDEPESDAADVTTESQPANPRRRWRFWRRRPPPTPVADETPAATAPRTPVGKAGRAATKATAPAAESEPEAEAPEEQPVLVPHRPAGKRLTIAAVAASVLFVAAGAFAGATLQPYLSDRATVVTKFDIAETAANAITTLWTYTPDDMESLPDRSARFLGGDFATEYRRYIDAIVPTNKQAQVSNTTQVLGTAVETLTPSEATALVYTNSVSTSPANKNIPSLRYLSYRLTLERTDARWLITRMDAVTQLDLTPQL
jgi:Mce-associated membrane protein